MDFDALRDDQWERIKGFAPGKDKRGPRTNNRLFLDALLDGSSGGRWRDLPQRLGGYDTGGSVPAAKSLFATRIKQMELNDP